MLNILEFFNIHQALDFDCAELADAADIIAAHPIALQLRNLQTMAEISVEKNSTIIFPAQMMSTVAEVKKFMAGEMLNK